MEAIITLKSKKDRSIERRHPWVFSGAIKSIEGHPTDGDVVTVIANKGRFLGRGLYSTAGSIAVRMLSFVDEALDDHLYQDRIRQAFIVREQQGLPSSETEIFRLLHAEGDQLPGLIIDVYGATAVMQCHDIGIHRRKQEIAAAILSCSDGRITSVYDKSRSTLPKMYAETVHEGFIIGEGESSGIFKEHGHRFKVDWGEGQKTGFFIDQRENRALLGRLSQGKKVLNTFCYTGGFSIYALAHGASEVHSLDSSQHALDLVEENVRLNGLDEKKHRCIKADAVEYVRELQEDYDIVILDPPAFAKGMKSRHNAVQGYKRLNGHAIRQLKPGGLLMTYSCSQVVTPTLFRDTILAAAITSGRHIRILEQLHQPGDHPVNIYHPEGEYLKGLVLQVE